jgi:hypothetical protein
MDVFSWIKGGILGTFILFCLGIWAFGGVIGVIIEAVRHDTTGVVLSILVPGFGIVVTILSLFGVAI